MSEQHHIIPIWFFVGFLLLVYGFLILVSGLAEWAHPPDTVLSDLHAPVWWGALLVALGVVYCVKYYPKREG
jgi:divalent metal cation (Fe/Co/Zn/Cd) transporter